jgi:hypothetical protein
MALSGNYTTLNEVLRRVRFQSGETIDLDEAAEWVSDILEMISPQDMLIPMITDGNQNEGHPEPVKVENYRGKLPCDSVMVTNIFNVSNFENMRESSSVSHRVNMSGSDKYKDYNPSYWSNINKRRDTTFQLKKGYIYTDFEKGELIVCYWGFPLDEEGNLLIPSDKKIVRAMASYIQYKIDYKLWRSGDINEKVYRDSEQTYLFDIGAADSFSKIPSNSRMENIKNYMRSFVSNDKNFVKHFSSFGQPDK